MKHSVHPPQYSERVEHLYIHVSVCVRHHDLHSAGGDEGGCGNCGGDVGGGGASGGGPAGGSTGGGRDGGDGTKHSAHAPQFLERPLSVHLVTHDDVCHAHQSRQTGGGSEGGGEGGGGEGGGDGGGGDGGEAGGGGGDAMTSSKSFVTLLNQ